MADRRGREIDYMCLAGSCADACKAGFRITLGQAHELPRANPLQDWLPDVPIPIAPRTVLSHAKVHLSMKTATTYHKTTPQEDHPSGGGQFAKGPKWAG